CPRPQRGSLKIFMFGVHTERLRKRLFSCPFLMASLYLALTSSDTALNTTCTRLSLKEAAIPIGSGKTVTSPLLARPCSASLHQLKFLMPRRGIAGDWSSINEAFSSNVNRPIKSFARSAEVRLGF